jgi:hypothetical protein
MIEKKAKSGTPKPGGPERAERLKAALRENLRRRKAQARGRVEGPSDSPPAHPGEGGNPGPRSES